MCADMGFIFVEAENGSQAAFLALPREGIEQFPPAGAFLSSPRLKA